MKHIITALLLFLASCGSMEYAPSNPADFGTFDTIENGNAGRVR